MADTTTSIIVQIKADAAPAGKELTLFFGDINANLKRIADTNTFMANAMNNKLLEEAAKGVTEIGSAAKEAVLPIAEVNRELAAVPKNAADAAVKQITMLDLVRKGYDRQAANYAYANAGMASGAAAIGKLGAEAEGASPKLLHFAGASYYVRGGIDAIRYAAAGGGARAAFYALDETFRGLMFSGGGVLKFLPEIGMSLVALLPLIVTIGEAWSAYKAKQEAARAEGDKFAQTQSLIATNLERINEAQKRGLINPDDYAFIQKLLTIGSDSALNSARQHMASLGIGGSFEDYDKLKSLERELHENVMEHLDQESAKAYDTYQKRLEDIRKLTQTGGMTAPEGESATQAAMAEYNFTMGNVEKQKQIKAFQDIQEAYKNSQVAIISAAQAGKEKREGYTKEEFENEIVRLHDLQIKYPLAQEEIDKAVTAAIEKRNEGIRSEATQKQKISDLENEIHAATLTGVDQEIAKIQDKYQKLRDELMIQSNSLEIQKALNELATAEANEIQKAKTAELEKQLQLKLELQRSDAEIRLKQIESDPFLTKTEKTKQSIPAIQDLQVANNADMQAQLGIASDPANSLEVQSQALDKYLQLKEKQLELDNQLSAAENQNNFAYQFEAALTNIQSRWSTWSMEISNAFQNAWQGATSAVSSGLTQLFEYGAQKGQWFREIWNGVIGSMISSMTQVVVNWVMSHIIMSGISTAWHALESALGIQRVAQKAAEQTAIVTIEGTGANARIIFRTGEAAHDAAMTGVQVGTHAGGEAAKTGTTAAGASMRGVIRAVETVYHGILTGIKVAIHAAGEEAMTGATMLGSIMRHMFVFAELQPYILLTALEAAASVAAIPGIGWAMAIPTFVVTLAALEGLAMFEKGGYTGDDIGMVHPREFVFSAAAVSNVGLGNLTRWHDAAKQGRISADGPAAMPATGRANQHYKVSNYLFHDSGKMARAVEQDDAHEVWVANIAARTVQKMRG